MGFSCAVGRDGHLTEPLLVSGDVLCEQLRQQLHVVRAHPHPRVDPHQARLLGRPLAEVEDEAQWIAVDEDGIRVHDLVGALLDLDPDRELTHSSTTSTWPSLTTSVSLTRISFTLPARGAVTEISIFIDSRIMSTWSSATSSPGLLVIFHTLPTSSALTSVMRASLNGRGSGPDAAWCPVPAASWTAIPRPRRGRDPGTGLPPSRPGRRCFSPSSPPPGRSCPPVRRGHCLPTRSRQPPAPTGRDQCRSPASASRRAANPPDRRGAGWCRGCHPGRP